jgi:hypothetical protein
MQFHVHQIIYRNNQMKILNEKIRYSSLTKIVDSQKQFKFYKK